MNNAEIYAGLIFASITSKRNEFEKTHIYAPRHIVLNPWMIKECKDFAEQYVLLGDLGGDEEITICGLHIVDSETVQTLDDILVL